MNNRTVKRIVTGVVLLVLALLCLRTLSFLTYLLLPVLAMATVIYAVALLLPRDLLNAVEAKLREGLDWLDFNLPPLLWPLVRGARVALDWLGLAVRQS